MELGEEVSKEDGFIFNIFILLSLYIFFDRFPI